MQWEARSTIAAPQQSWPINQQTKPELLELCNVGTPEGEAVGITILGRLLKQLVESIVCLLVGTRGAIVHD